MSRLHGGPFEIGALPSLATTLLIWLYFAVQESSWKQATIGKSVMGLKVTDQHGERLTFARATGRHLGKILSSAFLAIGYIMAGFTEKKQALHDMIAGTLVVKN
ncbi:MAG: RDD family protein [Saprospirales bacterium]|nr:RDD family protein [Saprospirales bacterium]